MELDLTTEDPLPGCANRRAVKHFGTVLDKAARYRRSPPRPHRTPGGPGHDAGCAHRTVELCRKAGVRFDAIDHCTVLARTIPEDIRSDELTHASVFAVQRPHGCIESLQGTLMRAQDRLPPCKPKTRIGISKPMRVF